MKYATGYYGTKLSGVAVYGEDVGVVYFEAGDDPVGERFAAEGGDVSGDENEVGARQLGSYLGQIAQASVDVGQCDDLHLLSGSVYSRLQKCTGSLFLVRARHYRRNGGRGQTGFGLKRRGLWYIIAACVNLRSPEVHLRTR